MRNLLVYFEEVSNELGANILADLDVDGFHCSGLKNESILIRNVCAGRNTFSDGVAVFS